MRFVYSVVWGEEVNEEEEIEDIGDWGKLIVGF